MEDHKIAILFVCGLYALAFFSFVFKKLYEVTWNQKKVQSMSINACSRAWWPKWKRKQWRLPSRQMICPATTRSPDRRPPTQRPWSCPAPRPREEPAPWFREGPEGARSVVAPGRKHAFSKLKTYVIAKQRARAKSTQFPAR